MKAAAIAQVPQTFSGISKAAVGNAKELLVNGFLWWYWGVFIVLTILGLEFLYALPVAIVVVAAISMVYGFVRAYNDSQTSALNQSMFPSRAVATGRLPGGLPVASVVTSSMATIQQVRTAPPVTMKMPPQTSTRGPIVGNRVLGIFHYIGCEWETKIVANNRVRFQSQLEAESAGYRACRICIP